MRVGVDHDRCIVSGMCTNIAPQVFEIGDDGTLHILLEDPPTELLDQIESAVMCCPVEALSLTEG